MNQENLIAKFNSSITNAALPPDVVTAYFLDVGRKWEEILLSDDPVYVFMKRYGLGRDPPSPNSEHFRLWQALVKKVPWDTRQKDKVIETGEKIMNQRNPI